MATSKKAAKEKLIDPDDLLDAEDFEFEDFLDEIGPEISTVSVFRVLRDGSREQIDKVPLSEIVTDVYGWLRENCGTGKFQLYFRGADRRYRGAKTVSVGERKPANGTTAAPNGNGSNSHQEFLEKQFLLQQQFVIGMIGAMKGPDVGSILQGMAQLAPKPQPQADPSAMLTAVATVFATLRGPQKDEDWLQRAKTIIELAQTMQPDRDREDNVWSVVRDVGKEVVHRLGAGVAGTAGTTTELITPAPAAARHVVVDRPADVALSAEIVSPVPARDNGAPAATAPILQNAPQNAEQWLRVGLNYLKEKARLFKDPAIYVDLIFDNIEEPQWKAIAGYVKEGVTFEQLLGFDPEIAQDNGLRNWFKRLFDDVHAEIFQNLDTGGTRGNADNLVDHATVSA